MEKRAAIVTGGSSGIGLQTAISLADSGCSVYTISRREFVYPGLTHVRADITDEEAVLNAVRSIYDENGRIDILVCAAGFGISGAIEYTELKEAKKQFDVNFFGMVNADKAVLPYMRQQQSGRIVNVSSMAAPAGIPFQAFYSASKAAIDSYTLALRNEIRQFGITACAVRPGDIATAFTDKREKSFDGDPEYNGLISGSVAKMEKDERNGMRPELAGKRIAEIALKKRVRPFYTIDFISGCETVLFSLLPSETANRIVGKMYS